MIIEKEAGETRKATLMSALESSDEAAAKMRDEIETVKLMSEQSERELKKLSGDPERIGKQGDFL